MPRITKKQLDELLRDAPDGVSHEDIISELKSRGHEIEGIDAAPVPEKLSLLETGRKAIANVLPSTGKLIKDTALGIVNIANPNPAKNTLVNLGRIGKGAVDSGVNRIKSAAGVEPTHTESEAMFQGVTDFFKERYGSLDALKTTIATDPAGFLFDLTSVIQPAAAGLKGAGKAGAVAGKIADAANPLEQIGKAAGKAGELIKTGADRLTGGAISRGTVGWGTGQFDPATANVFKAAGVQPLAGIVTRNRAVQNIYAFAAKYLFGGKLDDRIDELGFEINQRAETIANSVRNTNLNFSNSSLGDTITKRFTNYLDNFRRESETVYSPIVAATADEAADLGQTAAALKGILERKGMVLGGDKSAGEFQRIAEAIAADKPTIGELRATRSYVGEKMVTNGADPGWSQLYATLSEDLTASVRKISPELADRLAEADAQYQRGMTMIQEGIGRSITGSGTPEAIVQNVIRPNSPTYIRQLRQVIGNDNMELVGTSVLKDIADKASKQVSIPSLEKAGATEALTVVDPQRFLKAVESWPDESLRAALTDEQYGRLKAAVDQMRGVDVMKQAAGRMGKTMAGSQTGFTVGNVRAIFGASSALSALVTGNAIPVVTFIGALAGESVLTRFLDSPIGYQFFTTGFRPGLADQYMRALTGAKAGADAAIKSKVPTQVERTTQSQQK